LAVLARKFLEFRINEAPTGYLRAQISQIDLSGFDGEPLTNYYYWAGSYHVADKVMSSDIKQDVDTKADTSFYEGKFDLLSNDYFLDLHNSGTLRKRHHHRGAKYLELSKFTKLRLQYPLADAVTGTENQTNSSANAHSPAPTLLREPKGVDLGKRTRSAIFQKKAIEKDFETIKICIDNFLLSEFNYDAQLRKLVSRETLYSLIESRASQASDKGKKH